MVVGVRQEYPIHREGVKEAINQVIKPLSYARVTIIDGEQGSGKSMSAVAIVVDATFDKLTWVVLPSGERCEAEPVRNKEGDALVGYARVRVNGKFKVMRLPSGSGVIADNVKVFYNGHLHGIRHVHMELVDIISHLNSGDDTLKHCYLIIDEAYIGADRREGLSPLVKVLSKLSKQLRKRHIHLIMCTPDSSELDLRFQKIEVEHIACSYDEETKMVTKFIRNRKKYKKTIEISYHSQLYRKYYDTDEIFQLTDVQIERAMAMASMGEDDEN